MNGRAYDYNLGRFLSVDPFIQAPGNSQSMNPYSYIMNNPLAGTDPSGYMAEVEVSDRDGRCMSVKCDIDKMTADVRSIDGLLGQKFTTMKKELILNLSDVKEKLTEGIIDNIEGITFGPKLPNGNRLLILVADDNFQKFGRQLNQFLFFEQILN